MIYVDGAPSEATSATDAMIANSAPLLFGGSNRSGTPTATMDGLIDEARVYTGVLTDQEIDALFAAPGLPPTPTPTSTATPTATSTAAPTASPTPGVPPNPTATPTFVAPDAVLDDFFCDKTKTAKGAPKFAPITGVHVVTAFDDVAVDAKKPTALCLPADKNAEGVLDEATHLEAYQIKPIKGAPKHVPRKALVAVNQLGSLSLDTVKPDLLLVPTGKSLVGAAGLPDSQSLVSRFVCYGVKITKGAAKFPGAQVSVRDQFTHPAKNFVLKKPTRLCAPAEVNGTPPTNAAVHLLCYKAVLAKTKPKQAKFVKRVGVFVNNQFGAGTLDVTGQSELCIPTLRAP